MVWLCKFKKMTSNKLFNKAISLNSKDYSAYNNIANSYKSLLINEKAYLNYENV